MAHIGVIQGHLGNHIVLIERRKWKLQTYFKTGFPEVLLTSTLTKTRTETKRTQEKKKHIGVSRLVLRVFGPMFDLLLGSRQYLHQYQVRIPAIKVATWLLFDRLHSTCSILVRNTHECVEVCPRGPTSCQLPLHFHRVSFFSCCFFPTKPDPASLEAKALSTKSQVP